MIWITVRGALLMTLTLLGLWAVGVLDPSVR